MAAVIPELGKARRLVIKIGSALLVDPETGQLRQDWLRSLAEDTAHHHKRGAKVVLVSSGSIALGRRVLGLPAGALSLDQSQAAAAVGQIRLARAYEEALAPHGIVTAQVLVTLEDSANRRRYLNSRATLEQLLGLGALPIVNENDTVATDEIRFGDNDRLAAQVAVTIGADQLVLLSDVDGLYTANPQHDTNATRLAIVPEITPKVEAMAGDAASEMARGGMRTKLLAAKTAVRAGCAMVIAKGAVENPLRAIEHGAATTWFLAQTTPQAARKGWITSMKPKGALTLDAGAARALSGGKSLLAAGVTGVSGTFERGDPIDILDPDGKTLGRGLVAYSAAETLQIKGRKSGEIAAILGYQGRPALIHRDDMAL